MNVFDFTVKDNKGEMVSLSKYTGKVLFIVNTATRCGLTPQYEALAALYVKYQSRGLEILDFPCNQFLSQAPETDEKIAEFCKLNYRTLFPRFAKIDVNGKNADPLYTWLKAQIPEDTANDESKLFENKVKLFKPFAKYGDVKWNFGKFITDREGNVCARYSPAHKPEYLEDLLKGLLGI